ncbi:hypothetical protein LOC67_17725 [Stieleria sp. JC731]|nr:hypothetical protein [Stieleria sp. JC731]MCC9602393.1 hypothetical protein [Stieleria sp. JC731]
MEPACGFEPACGCEGVCSCEPACGCEGGCSCGSSSSYGPVYDGTVIEGDVIESEQVLMPPVMHDDITYGRPIEKAYQPQRERKIFNPRSASNRGFLNEYHR